MIGYYVDVLKGTAIVLLVIYYVARRPWVFWGPRVRGNIAQAIGVLQRLGLDGGQGRLLTDEAQLPIPNGARQEEADGPNLVVGSDGRFFRCVEARLDGAAVTHVTEVDREGIPCGSTLQFAGSLSNNVSDLI
jgi:hypothetical protein